jgi:hypothetical protein
MEYEMQSMRNAAMSAAIVATGVFVGSATAGSVNVDSLSNNAAASLQSGFGNAGNAGDGVASSLWRTFSGSLGTATGSTGGTTGSLNFGAAGQTGSSVGTFTSLDTQANTRFYLDVASGLANNLFTGPRPDGNTPTLGFGTTGSGSTGTGPRSSNDVLITFNPGVSAFGFNFSDLDNGGGFQVFFNDGTTAVVDLVSGQGIQDGFVSIIAASGAYINSVRLFQPNFSVAEGITVYDFTTISIVPLPPAAWAGLAMLGGIAGVRKMRRR